MAIYDPNQQQPAWQPPDAPAFTAPQTGLEQTTGGDRWALIALAVSLTVLLSCVPGLNCLAFLAPLVVGVGALTQAKNAANPSRARTYGWIATGIGIVILLGFVAIIVLYGALFIQLLNDPSFQNEFR
jgi:hypothetical protein